MGLFGDWLAAILVTPDCKTNGSGNDDADDSRNGKHRLLEVVDHFGIRAFGLPGVLRCIRRTRAQKGGGASSRQGAQGKSTRLHHGHAKARARSQQRQATVIHGTNTSIDCPATPGTVRVRGASWAIEGLL